MSWKTTLAGALAAAGTGMQSSSDHTTQVIGQVLAAIGTFLVGLFARDNNKTSEQVNAGGK